MTKNQQIIKLFVVLLFSTAFIFSFSYFGAEAFDSSTTVNGNFLSGTTIGYLNVSGRNKNETATLLEEKYVEWLKESKISLQYQEKSVPFDMSLFHLDSSKTVENVKNGQQNPAVITIDKSRVKEQLQILFPQLNISSFDVNKLTVSLSADASKFQTGEITLNLYNDFLLADQVKKDAVLSTVTITLKQVPEDIQSFVDNHSKIEIPANSTFSLLGYINEMKVKVQPEALDILATAIYQSILPTNFDIRERNISASLPDYAKLGYEAKVNQVKKMDLLFSNPNHEKCYLELNLAGNQLNVFLKGEQLLYTYKISEKDLQKLTPKTIIQYSPLVLPGKTIIENQGIDGQIIKIYRDVYQGDQFMKSEFISEDYYAPGYRIEIHALAGSANTGTTPAAIPSNNGTGTQTTTSAGSTSQTGTQTTTDTQPVSNETDLWGTPNEQPK